MNNCNQNVQIKVKMFPPAKEGLNLLPAYATPGSAGLDLIANLSESVTLEPGERVKIPTGIAIALPSRFFVGLVFARSGLATKAGITMANGVGVIDSDYTGEIICPLLNIGQSNYSIEPGDRIAQLVICPIVQAHFQLVEELEGTERGRGGFGSTGIR